MALVNGDMVIPAGVFNSVAGVADLSVGTLCPGGVPVGIYSDGTASTTDNVVYNNGMVSTEIGAVASPLFRKCTPYTGATLMGKRVRLTGKPPAFDGAVIQEFDTELDDTNGDGTQTSVVVVKTQQFTYIAEPGSLEEI